MEDELLNRLMQGDKQAKEILIQKNLCLVAYIAKKHASKKYKTEDNISLGVIGLMKAINTYEFNKNIKFSTYVSRCIEDEILMRIKNMQCSDSEGKNLDLDNISPNKSDSVSKQIKYNEDKKAPQSVFKNLNNRELEIISLFLGLNGYNEHTEKQIANKLGLSHSHISIIIRRITARLIKESEDNKDGR